MIDFIVSIDSQSVDLDRCQPWKIGYSLLTILFLVFVYQLAGIKTWKEVEDFIEMHASLLSKYVDLDKRAVFNLNVIRKWCFYFLKVIQFPKKDLSYLRKQHYISVHLADYLPQLFEK